MRARAINNIINGSYLRAARYEEPTSVATGNSKLEEPLLKKLRLTVKKFTDRSDAEYYDLIIVDESHKFRNDYTNM